MEDYFSCASATKVSSCVQLKSLPGDFLMFEHLMEKQLELFADRSYI